MNDKRADQSLYYINEWKKLQSIYKEFNVPEGPNQTLLQVFPFDKISKEHSYSPNEKLLLDHFLAQYGEWLDFLQNFNPPLDERDPDNSKFTMHTSPVIGIIDQMRDCVGLGSYIAKLKLDQQSLEKFKTQLNIQLKNTKLNEDQLIFIWAALDWLCFACVRESVGVRRGHNAWQYGQTKNVSRLYDTFHQACIQLADYLELDATYQGELTIEEELLSSYEIIQTVNDQYVYKDISDDKFEELPINHMLFLYGQITMELSRLSVDVATIPGIPEGITTEQIILESVYGGEAILFLGRLGNKERIAMKASLIKNVNQLNLQVVERMAIDIKNQRQDHINLTLAGATGLLQGVMRLRLLAADFDPPGSNKTQTLYDILKNCHEGVSAMCLYLSDMLNKDNQSQVS